jgi:hypothetical protein
MIGLRMSGRPAAPTERAEGNVVCVVCGYRSSTVGVSCPRCHASSWRPSRVRPLSSSQALHSQGR